MQHNSDEACAPDSRDETGILRVHRLAQLWSVVAVAIAVLALLGWEYNMRLLAGQWDGNIPTPPSSALACILLGGGIFCYARWPEKQRSHLLSLVAAGLAALIGLLVLLHFSTGLDSGIESALTQTNDLFGKVPLGRMSPLAAATFVLESCALILLIRSSRMRHAASIVAVLALIAIATNIVILMGYLFGAPLLYGGTIIPVAMPTALAFSAIGTGLFTLAQPRVPALRPWSGDTMRGVLLRSFLPAILLVAIGDDVMNIFFHLAHDRNPALSTALVAIVSAVLAVLITSLIARRTGDTLARANEALARAAQRDHHIADALQQIVMPSNGPMHPEGYEVFAKYQPALSEAEVCGDFCDLFDLGDGKLGIAVGDIVGKGLLAAVRVAAARHAIRCYAFVDDRPSNVMSLVNDALCRDIVTENDMLTAFFAVLDTKNDVITYCNAGHEPPLVRHSDGSVEFLKLGGPMFVGMGWRVYVNGRVSVQDGDIFILVTDGITEAGSDKRMETYGAEGILRYLAENVDASAEQIADGILKDAASFANGTLHDDAAIVVIRKVDSLGAGTT